MTKAVLLVGHGSRRSEANKALFELQNYVQLLRPQEYVKVSFMEAAEPDVATAISELNSQGKTEITVVPVFLYNGIHITEDLPAILDAVKAKHPQLNIKLAAVLGIDQRLAEIVWERVDAAF